MHRFALPLALVAASLVAAVPAQAAPRALVTPPIECIYHGLHKDDWPTLVKVIRQSLQGQTPAEKAMVERIREATARCRQQHGWGKKREAIALRYFAGRALSSDSTFNLKKYGLDYEQLQALVARLDAPTRQAYVSGQVSNEQSAATFAALTAVGIGLDAIPAEERGAFAQKLSQGVLGEVLKMQAETDFAAS